MSTNPTFGPIPEACMDGCAIVPMRIIELHFKRGRIYRTSNPEQAKAAIQYYIGTDAGEHAALRIFLVRGAISRRVR